MALSGSLGWKFTMAPGGRAGHSQEATPLLLKFPVPSLFITLKLLHFSFFPVCLCHSLTLWWLPLQAGHEAGRPLSNNLSLCYEVWQQAGVYSPSVLCARGQVSGWHSGPKVSAILPLPMLYCMVVRGALCVYGPPYPTPWAESRSVGVFSYLH